MEPDKTSTLLVEHLRKKPDCKQRNDLIDAARLFYYDDFRSELAMPKTQLYEDLHAAGYADLATNVTRGDYD